MVSKLDRCTSVDCTSDTPGMWGRGAHRRPGRRHFLTGHGGSGSNCQSIANAGTDCYAQADCYTSAHGDRGTGTDCHAQADCYTSAHGDRGAGT